MTCNVLRMGPPFLSNVYGHWDPRDMFGSGFKRGRAPQENRSVFSWEVRMGESKDVEQMERAKKVVEIGNRY